MNWSITLACLLIFASCAVSSKKGQPSHHVRLSKVISWNPTTPAKYINITSFQYDNQKRVVGINWYYGDSISNEIKDSLVKSFQFFYSGKDKCPFKSVGHFFFSDVDTMYHFYNTNGVLIRDSCVPKPYTITIVKKYFYDYPAGKVIARSFFKTERVTDECRDSFTVADHNITLAFRCFKPDEKPIKGYRMHYDNKVNPYSKLYIFDAAAAEGFSPPLYLAANFCKNNITERTWVSTNRTDSVVAIHSTFYKYDYNKNDLPEKCRVMFADTLCRTIGFYYLE